MEKIIYHGSQKIIKKPEYGLGKSNNDYGRGFYCTEDLELAKEWACKKNTNGFANIYTLTLENLNVINLNSNEYNILNWLALLTKHRGYWQAKSVAEQAKFYLQENYLIDTSSADIIIGNRADDSYFSFAQDFIMGTIPLKTLAQAMNLGKLGEQIVLKSEKAFDKINYIDCDIALSSEYYIKKTTRDSNARKHYTASKNNIDYTDDIFIIDIIRGRIKDDDLRIQ